MSGFPFNPQDHQSPHPVGSFLPRSIPTSSGGGTGTPAVNFQNNGPSGLYNSLSTPSTFPTYPSGTSSHTQQSNYPNYPLASNQAYPFQPVNMKTVPSHIPSTSNHPVHSSISSNLPAGSISNPSMYSSTSTTSILPSSGSAIPSQPAGSISNPPMYSSVLPSPGSAMPSQPAGSISNPSMYSSVLPSPGSAMPSQPAGSISNPSMYSSTSSGSAIPSQPAGSMSNPSMYSSTYSGSAIPSQPAGSMSNPSMYSSTSTTSVLPSPGSAIPSQTSSFNSSTFPTSSTLSASGPLVYPAPSSVSSPFAPIPSVYSPASITSPTPISLHSSSAPPPGMIMPSNSAQLTSISQAQSSNSSIYAPSSAVLPQNLNSSTTTPGSSMAAPSIPLSTYGSINFVSSSNSLGRPTQSTFAQTSNFAQTQQATTTVNQPPQHASTPLPASGSVPYQQTSNPVSFLSTPSSSLSDYSSQLIQCKQGVRCLFDLGVCRYNHPPRFNELRSALAEVCAGNQLCSYSNCCKQATCDRYHVSSCDWIAAAKKVNLPVEQLGFNMCEDGVNCLKSRAILLDFFKKKPSFKVKHDFWNDCCSKDHPYSDAAPRHKNCWEDTIAQLLYSLQNKELCLYFCFLKKCTNKSCTFVHPSRPGTISDSSLQPIVTTISDLSVSAASPLLGNDSIPKRVRLLWDLENCAVPKSHNAGKLINVIRDKIQLLTSDSIQLLSWVVCHIRIINEKLREELHHRNVEVIAVGNDKQSSADHIISDKINLICEEAKQYGNVPTTIILISGDKDFSRDVNKIRDTLPFIHFILIHKRNSNSNLLLPFHRTYVWENILDEASDSTSPLTITDNRVVSLWKETFQEIPFSIPCFSKASPSIPQQIKSINMLKIVSEIAEHYNVDIDFDPSANKIHVNGSDSKAAKIAVEELPSQVLIQCASRHQLKAIEVAYQLEKYEKEMIFKNLFRPSNSARASQDSQPIFVFKGPYSEVKKMDATLKKLLAQGIDSLSISIPDQNIIRQTVATRKVSAVIQEPSFSKFKFIGSPVYEPAGNTARVIVVYCPPASPSPLQADQAAKPNLQAVHNRDSRARSGFKQKGKQDNQELTDSHGKRSQPSLRSPEKGLHHPSQAPYHSFSSSSSSSVSVGDPLSRLRQLKLVNRDVHMTTPIFDEINLNKFGEEHLVDIKQIRPSLFQLAALEQSDLDQASEVINQLVENFNLPQSRKLERSSVPSKQREKRGPKASTPSVSLSMSFFFWKFLERSLPQLKERGPNLKFTFDPKQRALKVIGNTMAEVQESFGSIKEFVENRRSKFGVKWFVMKDTQEMMLVKQSFEQEVKKKVTLSYVPENMDLDCHPIVFKPLNLEHISIEVVRGSILDQSVDAILLQSTPSLEHVHELSKLVMSAASTGPQQECADILFQLNQGFPRENIYVTSSGALFGRENKKVRYLLHLPGKGSDNMFLNVVSACETRCISSLLIPYNLLSSQNAVNSLLEALYQSSPICHLVRLVLLADNSTRLVRALRLRCQPLPKPDESTSETPDNDIDSEDEEDDTDGAAVSSNTRSAESPAILQLVPMVICHGNAADVDKFSKKIDELRFSFKKIKKELVLSCLVKPALLQPDLSLIEAFEKKGRFEQVKVSWPTGSEEEHLLFTFTGPEESVNEAKEFVTLKMCLHESVIGKFPSEWNLSLNMPERSRLLIALSSSSHELQQIFHFLSANPLPHATIHQIERIQNLPEWLMFYQQQEKQKNQETFYKMNWMFFACSSLDPLLYLTSDNSFDVNMTPNGLFKFFENMNEALHYSFCNPFTRHRKIIMTQVLCSEETSDVIMTIRNSNLAFGAYLLTVQTEWE